MIFIKLGGSLITDKRQEKAFRADVMARLAQEIAAANVAPLLIGHGSGSFGHVTAKQHGTMQGVQTADQWRGFAEVATVAAELNYLVADTLSKAGVPAWRIQPSASAQCHDGKITQMALSPIQTALEKGIVPLVYGDVALDDVRGGTIVSTETVMSYLVDHLPVKRIILLGEVPGVLDEQGEIIPRITPQNIAQYQGALGGSEGTDVTGGMLTKVTDMLELVRLKPDLAIQIIDGREPGLLYDVLKDATSAGTLIINK